MNIVGCTRALSDVAPNQWLCVVSTAQPKGCVVFSILVYLCKSGNPWVWITIEFFRNYQAATLSFVLPSSPPAYGLSLVSEFDSCGQGYDPLDLGPVGDGVRS